MHKTNKIITQQSNKRKVYAESKDSDHRQQLDTIKIHILPKNYSKCYEINITIYNV